MTGYKKKGNVTFTSDRKSPYDKYSKTDTKTNRKTVFQKGLVTAMSNSDFYVYLRPEHTQVTIQDPFWSLQKEKLRTVTVWDVIHKFETDRGEGILKNFEDVARGLSGTGHYVASQWFDGLLYEVIQGASDMLADSYEEALSSKLEEWIEKITAAQIQDPDGYLNTYSTLMCPSQRLGRNGCSLILLHELYNIGCLVEAGVHYYRATGKENLLSCGVKVLNYLCTVIGPKPLENIVPAHSLAEEAVIKLYRLLTDDPGLCQRLSASGISVEPQKYLNLAEFWITHRGIHHNRTSFPHYMGEYAQDHCPVEEQHHAVGHAVRAALLYAGITTLGIETGNKKYFDIVKRLWEDVEKTKLHISGGIGAYSDGERFGNCYELPGNAYLETCAGAALAFWAGEMHRAFGHARYMDVFECALYNNILPCLSVDGTHYFYENPLISDGSRERWSWHECPCCPPMLLKLMGALGDYIYSLSPDKKTLAVNLLMGSDFHGEAGSLKDVTVNQRGALPWEGKHTITVHTPRTASFTLKIRIPRWAGAFTVTLKEESINQREENGYVSLTREWKDGDEVVIDMEMPAVKVMSHPYVDANHGCVALMRGPLLYCMEEKDNPAWTEAQVLAKNAPLKTVSKDLFGPVICLETDSAAGTTVHFIPYYLWNNRGKGKMTVWVHQQGLQSDRLQLEGWEDCLYRRFQ